ncbi:uncharacterized protein AMSG_03686 [Thecamonas trahens ATCC 50062]|uniref:Uncharacterized protein n=1 Tax=Thecamonas trahens ATCC 50062 TaxID=461836 RepID=A0A0L0D5A6_THETB|nr:hypothetical protein AMSG_03686 [Thecamonas trahens ATCC 50062]KNC47256.1 hypothetical protein AMSG_03686 [Thecamonas trahens ATCC 50062]|eukprot:XP_013759599.1 hypothetical protein AMSG_03686 [Thecamonas trahens ATCC 50062]
MIKWVAGHPQLLACADGAVEAYLGYAVHAAAKAGFVQVVRGLVDEGLYTGPLSGDEDDTALMLAARGGHAELVRWMITESGMEITADDAGSKADIRAALVSAAHVNDLATVQVLLSAGVSMTATESVPGGYLDLTPAAAAAQGGALETLQWLVAEDVGCLVGGDQPPLAAAASRGQLSIVQWLVEHAGVDVDEVHDDGGTAACAAAAAGHALVVKWLVSSANADLNRGDEVWPLVAAAGDGNMDLVQWLVAAGADVTKHAKYAETAVEAALSHDRPDIAQWLVSSGGASAALALHAAVSLGNEAFATWLVDNQGVDIADVNADTDLFLAAVATDNVALVQWVHDKVDLALDPFLRPIVLIHAAVTGVVAFVEWLLDDDRWLAPLLYLAASSGETEMAKWLVGRGAQGAVAVVSDLPSELITGEVSETFESSESAHIVVLVAKRAWSSLSEHIAAGYTPMHLAAHTNETQLLALLMEEGKLSPAARGSDGTTPLLCAAQYDALDAARFLVDVGGADADEARDDKTTPLYLASVYGHTEMVVWLAESCGANTGVQKKNGDTPLLIAANNGQLEVIQWLVTEGNEPTTVTNSYGSTPLFLAAMKGHVHVVRWLALEAGAQVDVAKPNGDTPLLIAVNNNHLAVVECLVRECGADVNLARNDGATPLYLAALKNHVEIIDWLIAHGGADVEQPRSTGSTPLYVAAVEGHLAAAQRLLAGGASPTAANNRGTTPLLIAASNGHAHIVRWLVTDVGVDVNATQPNGDTTLLIAAFLGNVELVRWLVATGGADVNKARNDGVTPLYIACVQGHAEVVAWLAAYPATDVNLGKPDGTSPLHEAIQPIDAALDMVSALVATGRADLDLAQSDGKTALGVAARLGILPLVAYLVVAGARVTEDVINSVPAHSSPVADLLHLAHSRDILRRDDMLLAIDNPGVRAKLAAAAFPRF